MRIARAAVLASLLGACARGTPLGDLLHRDLTPYERYADGLRRVGLDSTAVGRDWLAASDSALRAALQATLPHHEFGTYRRDEARAIAHRVELRGGQRLLVEVRASGLPARLFVDLYRVRADTAQPFAHVRTADTVAGSRGTAWALAHEGRDDEVLIVRVQPELLREGRYELLLRLEPILAFPVEGHGNRAIRSFFGAERDAGARSHEGIDIFAPRGTPVLAATAGVVRSTRANRLGGNVVWLVDEARGQSLYYAHLDTQSVRPGDVVIPGDTLGFVGNTGNARTTPPHLHFGIYRRPGGAIDPLDWVRRVDSVPARLRADTSRLGSAALPRRAPALHRGPDRGGIPLDTLSPADTVLVLGAVGDWYRVQLRSGVSGYISAGSLRRVTPREQRISPAD